MFIVPNSYKSFLSSFYNWLLIVFKITFYCFLFSTLARSFSTHSIGPIVGYQFLLSKEIWLDTKTADDYSKIMNAPFNAFSDPSNFKDNITGSWLSDSEANYRIKLLKNIDLTSSYGNNIIPRPTWLPMYKLKNGLEGIHGN